MKYILMINSEFPPLGGGQGKACKNVLAALSEADDLRVDLITASVDHRHEADFASNITITALDIGKRGKGIHYQTVRELLTFSWQSWWHARNLVRKRK